MTGITLGAYRRKSVIQLAWRAATALVALATVGAMAAVAMPATSAATPTVQRLGYCGGDDWEPAMTSDASHVYVLITHFAGDTTCDPNSGLNNSRIMIQVSNDGGKTFSAPAVVANTPGGLAYPEQADPSIAIDKVTGDVYVSFLAYGLSGNGHTDIYVAKSTNFGQTFSQAVQANAKGCKNCDHEKILAYNNIIYDAYTQGSGHFVSVSTDGGATFTQNLVDGNFVVGFAEGAVFDSQHNAWFVWGDCSTSNCTGTTAGNYRVSETLAGGGTTTFSPVLATSPEGPDCPYSKCGFSYFGPQDAIAIDSAGTLYMAWQTGQTSASKSPPIINLSSCSANCTTAAGWSFVSRVDDKTADNCPNSACYALFPQIVAAGPGQLYATWIDDRNNSLSGVIDHKSGYNIYIRSSTNGGATWTGPGQQVSQYDPTQSQSTPNGFLFPYGDYTDLIMNTTCATPAPAMAWGEGHNWVGGATAPGHIEFTSFC